jgi:hypothetical protein
MQALIIRQPFKIHDRYIAIFDDEHTAAAIRQWLMEKLHCFDLSDRPDVTVVTYEHFTEEKIHEISYAIIHAEGFIKLELKTIKLNELCN